MPTMRFALFALGPRSRSAHAKALASLAGDTMFSCPGRASARRERRSGTQGPSDDSHEFFLPYAIARPIANDRGGFARLSSHHLARRYKLYAEPRPAPTCGLVLMNSSSVSLSIERVCSVPSAFGNVLAVNFIVNVCLSSSTV